jgi:hypothetical protein
MPFHFPFTTNQILWTLTFAAQLVLLVVLLGRDRIKRYPWFTASMVLFPLRLLAEILLSGRMPTFILQCIFIPLAEVTGLVSLLVAVEMARRAFAGAGRKAWLVCISSALILAGVVLAFWGQWPAWREISFAAPLLVLRQIQFLAQKTDMLVDLLSIELGILVLLFGRKFKAGWHSHTQRIVIGLSTVSISWLAVQAAWQIVTRNAHPTSQAEYEHIVGLGNHLVTANKIVYLIVLLWWIVSLWIDEPVSAVLVSDALPAQDASLAVDASPAETAETAVPAVEEESQPEA